MKILLVGVVCFLFAFITTNDTPSEANVNESPSPNSAPAFGQCPPCIAGDGCVANGYSISTNTSPASCNGSDDFGHTCTGGHYNNTAYFFDGPGRDELRTIDVPCEG